MLQIKSEIISGDPLTIAAHFIFCEQSQTSEISIIIIGVR